VKFCLQVYRPPGVVWYLMVIRQQPMALHARRPLIP
jgi:hypothetical protein